MVMPACANITALNLMLKPIFRIRLGLDGEMAHIMHSCDPPPQLLEAADRLVFAAIDLCLACGFGAGSGKRDRRALVAPGFVFLASAGFARRASSRAGGGGLAFDLVTGRGTLACEKVAVRRVAKLVDLLGKRKR